MPSVILPAPGGRPTFRLQCPILVHPFERRATMGLSSLNEVPVIQVDPRGDPDRGGLLERDPVYL